MVRLTTAPLLLSITAASLSTLPVVGGESINGSEIFQLAKTTLERALKVGDYAETTTTTAEVQEDAKTATKKSNNSMNDKPAAAADTSSDGNNDVTKSSDGGTAANNDSSEERDLNLTYDGSDLIEWINSNGGFIHPNARIGLDPTGQYRGVFVKSVGEDGGTEEGIEDGDIIARIPWDLIVTTEDYSYDVFWNCDALHSLYREFQLGDDSKYAPYVNYLKNQPRGRIPSEWSDAGKKLLETILDHPNNDKAKKSSSSPGLPPIEQLKGYEEVWLNECKGEDTDLAKAAYYQFTSRDEDTLMVPFYDMHNHSNDPKKLNTISKKPDRKGLPFMLHAIRDIEPGEQIFISYNRCHRCWFDETYRDCTTHSYYGTPELFDIFGFVEDYPQMWKFPMDIGEKDHRGKVQMDELKFCLERPNENGPLVVTFGDNYTPNPEEEAPVMKNIEILGAQLNRLKELEGTIQKDTELMESMPRHEWDTIWTYHKSMMTSISAAVLASGLVNEGDDPLEKSATLVGDSEGEDDEDEGSSDDVGEGSSDDEEASSDDEEESSDDDEEEEEEKVQVKKVKKLKKKSGIKGMEARSDEL